MSKQTTVEWLQLALEHTILNHEQVMQTIGLFEQAKEMEKEQVVDAYDAGLFDGTMDDVKDRIYNNYYKETFGGEQ